MDASGRVGNFPPLTPPGEFAQVECPQLVEIDGRELILFSCLDADHSAVRRARLGRPGATGTFAFSKVEGSFVPSTAPIADPSGPAGPLYAGKLVEVDAGDAPLRLEDVVLEG